MRAVGLVLAIAAVSLSACGKKDDTPKPGVRATADGYTVTSKDGSATVTTGAAAAKVATPDFAPLYPGAKVETSMVGMGDEESKGGTAVFKVSDPVETVLEFYRAKAKAAGMEAQMDANMGDAHMFAASNEATKQGLQVIASRNGSETNVQLIWAMPKS